MSDERTCGNCRWWRLVDEDTGIGRCHQHSPMPIIMFCEDEAKGEEAQAYWPACCDTHFCGEWVDGSITPEQEERRELVRQFAVAIVAAEWAAGYAEHEVWRLAGQMADMEPRRI